MTTEFKYRLKNLSWTNTLFLLLTPPVAIALIAIWIYVDGFDYRQILLGLLFYTMAGMSISAGYHRLFSHRSYSAHPLVRIFFLVFGASAFQNSILKWASDHRIHHTKVDTDEDPYNINEGFFYAHMGWIMLKQQSDFNSSRVRDLLNDKLCVIQTQFYLPISIVFGIILPALCGHYFFGSLLGGFACGAFAKIVLLHHSTFFINSLCHCVGNKPYTDTNSAKDSWIMALFTFGEGYHNFHHFFQTDYRNGIRWFHFDPVKWLLKILEKIKLVSKLKQTPEFKIKAAQLQMKIQKYTQKYKVDITFEQELESIKETIVSSLKNFDDLKKQYKLKKNTLSKLNLVELKQRIDEAKIDFQYNLKRFEILTSAPAV